MEKIFLYCAHSPYQRGYRAYKKADVFKPMTRENTYDNAMIFNDYFIFSIFEIFKELSKKSSIPTYLYNFCTRSC